ncbi:Ltp family lipoprotein [Desulfonatronum sp. SC1]|uniref:Ltp family lipoprotein n=1 Tax=Desulfonatronum sp. SC1 TaxID=2109626 RepID=UPI0018EEB894|nr:Ltp family lipoprotein [Desulfonatronum sp. SC1]
MRRIILLVVLSLTAMYAYAEPECEFDKRLSGMYIYKCSVGSTKITQTPIHATEIPRTTVRQVQRPAQRQAQETTRQLTGPQKNAVRSAKAYLNFSGFSREGLINQLSSDAGDGYSVADATAAVDSLNIDFNE